MEKESDILKESIDNKKLKRAPLFDFKSVLGIINFCLVSITFIISVVVVVVLIARKAESAQIVRKVAPTIMIWAVYIIMAVFRIRLKNILQLILNLHIFMAAFLGTIIDFYSMISFYDDIMHGIFGFVGSVIALYICCKMTSGIRDLKPLFCIIVIFSIVSAMGALWEIFEFVSDNLFGQTAQGIKINGVAPYVTDTMWDIVFNSIGSIVFIALYLLNYFTKKNFLVKSLINEFSDKVK